MPRQQAEIPATKDWLEGIGLGRYADVFAQNRIGLDVLPDLTEADLEGLGLPLGDRKRLLRAAKASLAGATMAIGADDAGAEIEQEVAAGPGLAERSAATGPSVARPVAGAAERRQITVMFCDMVGSTELSEQLDPEHLREMIATYRETCALVVKRYDGFVARYSGDGILVYFGYPKAHEDDAERAVRTGLEIVRNISTLPGPSGEISAVRIGIATGLVVVGDLIGEGTEEHYSAVGDTPNLAARLQALAPPNCVVIASSTKSLLKGKFEYDALGTYTLKGISAPVQAWSVVRPSRVESRFAATAEANLTPLVNRQEEIALLLRRWQQASEYDGQAVVLSGEPGIGKSRIVEELRKRIGGEAHGQMSFQCSPYYTNTAFYPFVEQLKSIMSHDDVSPEPSLSTLEETLVTAAGPAERVVQLFAALLSVGTGDRYKPLELSPQRQKDDTISALVNHYVELARKRPTLMIFEDAHWVDPSSREVLDLLVDRIQDASALMIITCRPEFQPSWSSQSHITTLTLNRLSRQLQAAMIEGVAGAALPVELIDQIVLKTDGVPLFVEELTKTVLESDLISKKDGQYVFSGSLRGLAIPATLSDSLMARLDRMASFKQVAQIGATIGREFSYELLRALVETTAEELNAALGHLEEAGLIIRRGQLPEARYAFKHALVQDAAYSSLLRSEKKRLHARIAAMLAEMYPDKIEREPELLAHHFTEADQAETAVVLWLKAGKRAARARANLEAIAHLRRGLEILEADSAVADRDGIELALRLGLGVPLIAARGYAVRDVEENYLRALQLAKQLDDEQRVFEATRGLWVCYFIRADLVKARDLGAQLLALAERTDRHETTDQARQRTGHLIEAHRAMGQTMLYSGCFVTARDYFERGAGLYDPTLHGSLVEIHGIDPGIVCLSYLGYVLWFLGCPDQAREYSKQALSNAERMEHPFTLAFALAFRAYLCQHLRDVEGTRVHAVRAIAVSSEHGFLHWKHQATILCGWALVELGQIDDGLNQIRSGLAAYEATESELACPWFRSLLAAAYVRAGRPDAALRALDAALTVAERTGERFFVAEIHRLQGEITVMRRGSEAAAEAEACYQRALEICRKQQARSWELRTAVSLARLWRSTGKCRDAVQLLAPVRGMFQQGFDTPDLREAVQLISELENG